MKEHAWLEHNAISVDHDAFRRVLVLNFPTHHTPWLHESRRGKSMCAFRRMAHHKIAVITWIVIMQRSRSLEWRSKSVFQHTTRLAFVQWLPLHPINRHFIGGFFQECPCSHEPLRVLLPSLSLSASSTRATENTPADQRNPMLLTIDCFAHNRHVVATEAPRHVLIFTSECLGLPLLKNSF